jgi:hypothetical protein
VPNGALRRAFRSLARAEDGVLTDYGGTRGSLVERRLLLTRFAEDGIDASTNCC